MNAYIWAMFAAAKAQTGATPKLCAAFADELGELMNNRDLHDLVKVIGQEDGSLLIEMKDMRP